MLPHKPPILLILDLDETLIHATPEPLARPADFVVLGYHVYIRPQALSFLLECSQHFRLAIWSSAADDYVAAIVQCLVPASVPLEFVWGRSRCTYRFNQTAFEQDGYTNAHTHYDYIKILKKLTRRGYDLARVLLVDDTPFKAQQNYGNAIYISEYVGQPHDAELPLLLRYLVSLRDAPTVRAIEKRDWHLRVQP